MNSKPKWNKLLSLVLVCVMFVGMTPAMTETVFAEDAAPQAIEQMAEAVPEAVPEQTLKQLPKRSRPPMKHSRQSRSSLLKVRLSRRPKSLLRMPGRK